MAESAYQQFAVGHAERFGGRLLKEAMLRQVRGEDDCVTEINWRVAGFEPLAEICANISADYENACLRFSVDERPDWESEWISSLSFTLHIQDGKLVLAREGMEPVEDQLLVLDELQEFARIAEPDQQGE